MLTVRKVCKNHPFFNICIKVNCRRTYVTMVVTEFMEGFYSVYELGDHEVDCSLVDDGRTC
jgi:hypothetical protein